MRRFAAGAKGRRFESYRAYHTSIGNQAVTDFDNSGAGGQTFFKQASADDSDSQLTRGARALEVVMVYHDDWVVNVLVSDGRVYSFWTEMWPEHGAGAGARWDPVIARARRAALGLAGRQCETWALDGIPDTEQQFRAAMDFVCRHTSDAQFRRYTR